MQENPCYEHIEPNKACDWPVRITQIELQDNPCYEPIEKIENR